MHLLFKHITQFYDKKELLSSDEEISEEFLDPIMGCKIINPVCLPTVNCIMEKTVIEKILFEKSVNPYTQEPLTFEELLKYNE